VAGIYIHVPFCHRRCHYCDFYTNVNLSYLVDFYRALEKEIELRSHFLQQHNIETIYFGGGTPSILHAQAIEKIISKISQFYHLSSNCEITLEVNPEDVSVTYYQEVQQAGVNRLSIGVQSFDDYILKYLNRRHGSIHSSNSIEWALKAGITNISIDLIYGIPHMTEQMWESNIFRAIKYPIKHISAYHLTIEPGTTFGHLKNKGKLTEIAEDDSWKQMLLVHEILVANGFEHYEISNFALPGFRSRHNQSYWQGKEYLGLGPAAHSFDGKIRYENVRDLNRYIAAMLKGEPAMTPDELTINDQINETIMLQLRRKEGINKAKFIEQFGNEIYLQLQARATKYFPDYLDINEQGIKLNLKGWFISDAIVSELFFI
jgi:oxygen-independent coproporphyrinogen-3 oxidase